MTTIIRNTYRNGEFHHTEIVGTFFDHAEAEIFLNDHVLFGGRYEQIAPCGYERLNAEGKRAEHIIIANSCNRTRDVNGRWISVEAVAKPDVVVTDGNRLAATRKFARRHLS